MGEYINKELAMQAVDCLNLQKGIVEALKENIKDVPAADVKPVVRGRWIPFESKAAGEIWYCSACEVGCPHQTVFCPHCGADMRGGDAE